LFIDWTLTITAIHCTGTRLIPRDEDKAIYFYNLAVNGGGNNAPSARTHPSVPSASGQLGYLLAKRYTRLARGGRLGDTPLISEGGEKEEKKEESNNNFKSEEGTNVGEEGDGENEDNTDRTSSSSSSAISTMVNNNLTPPLSTTSFLSRDPSLNVTRIYELLSFAALRNDPHGGIGMGYLHMRGVGEWVLFVS
jgi:TPR repeat protein